MPYAVLALPAPFAWCSSRTLLLGLGDQDLLRGRHHPRVLHDPGGIVHHSSAHAETLRGKVFRAQPGYSIHIFGEIFCILSSIHLGVI